jgi:hypothetical protein
LRRLCHYELVFKVGCVIDVEYSVPMVEGNVTRFVAIYNL